MGKNFLIFLPIVIVFFAFYTLFFPGLHPTHDGEYHVVRFYEFDKVLRSGSLYPRWAPDFNNGFGVPFFTYVYPLPNYVSSIFHSLGLSFIDSFKYGMFASSVVGAIFIYLWVRNFWGNLGGIVASIFYTFAPYHMVDVFVRGSVGELWAMGLFPGALWAITKWQRTRKAIFFFYSVVLLSFTIFSHNILGLTFFAFFFSYIIVLRILDNNKKKYISAIILAALFALGIASIFWIPALFQQEFVEGLRVFDYQTKFPQLYQFFIPSWGSGFFDGDLGNQMSVQIGLANLAIILFSFGLFFSRYNEHKTLVGFILFSFFVTFFLMTQFSEALWRIFPILGFFQFPWRFLSLTIILSAFLSGFVVHVFTSFFKRQKVLSFLTIGVILFSPIVTTIGYNQPAYFHNRDDNYYISRPNFISGTNSPGNAFNTKWMDRGIKVRKKDSISNQGTHQTFKLVNKENGVVSLPIAYFPSWIVIVKSNTVQTVPDKHGLLSFLLPQGEHIVEAKLKEIPLEQFSLILSVVSFFGLIILTYSKRIYEKVLR